MATLDIINDLKQYIEVPEYVTEDSVISEVFDSLECVIIKDIYNFTVTPASKVKDLNNA